MLDESQAQFERGETISFTMEELKAMESDDWQPTQKVLDFERKHGIILSTDWIYSKYIDT